MDCVLHVLLTKCKERPLTLVGRGRLAAEGSNLGSHLLSPDGWGPSPPSCIPKDKTKGMTVKQSGSLGSAAYTLLAQRNYPILPR